MNINDLADFCEFHDCTVTTGNPEIGAVSIDGRGYQKRDNYRRFLSFNELSGLPAPRDVLAKATYFRIHRDNQTVELTREDFERQLDRFRQLTGTA